MPRLIRAFDTVIRNDCGQLRQRTQTRRRQCQPWLATAAVPGAALCARHHRPVHHGDLRLGRAVGRPDRPLRSAVGRFGAPPRRSRLAALAGHGLFRPRRLEPDHPWRPDLARGRHRLDRARRIDRRTDRARLRLSFRLGDLVFQRITDILQALPLLVLALVMSAALGPSLPNTIIAIAIPLIPTVSRVIRANTLALRELPFVEAAKSIGMSESRIAFRHVLPNTLAPLIVLATAQLGSTILTEASLSFLGLGIPEPYPSWGRMLSESAAEYVRTAPWLVIFPGIAISLAVFGTNLFGDALRDILDPRQRG